MSGTKTHEIVILDQKPSDDEVRKMVQEYFESEAKIYDEFNEKTDKRKRFIGKMNELIAEDLKKCSNIQNFLSVACGTGSRENEIKKKSGHDFQVTGVDVGPAMCAEAKRVGINIIESEWLAVDLGSQLFDAGAYLYSLGLSPSHNSRLQELKKIADHLKPGAPFYVDVMNLNDINEWGAELREIFAIQRLEAKGYDLGDTFYRRIGSSKTAYYHYFEEAKAVALLESAGFKVRDRAYIDCGKNYGALVGPHEGAILLICERPI